MSAHRTAQTALQSIAVEWERWLPSRHGRCRRAAWARRHRSLVDCDRSTLEAPTAGPATDALQAALVAEAQAGCHGALLTLTVQFRPAIAVLARSLGPGRPDGDAVDEVVGLFTEVVLGHDLSRRPCRIAGNLVGDTRQRLHRARRRITAEPVGTWMENVVDETGLGRVGGEGPEEAVGRLELLAAVSRSLDDLRGDHASRALTRELAYRSWILEQPNAAIAHELGLAPELVRTRLCRLRTAVRIHTGHTP